MRFRCGALLCTILVSAAALFASPPAEQCSGGASKKLEFWIGDWDVYSGADKVGQNSIARASDGCLVVERWTGTDGDSGVSFNYVDGSGMLRQTYVGPAWSIDYQGETDAAGVLLHSEVTSKGEPIKIRLSLQPQADGSVRQHKQASKTGDLWKTVYDFRYVRAAKSPLPGKPEAALRPCAGEAFHRLDFWTGNWDVFSPTGLAGYNHIERASGGCSLIENWKGREGDDGKSLNSYDVQRREWRQIWVSRNIILDLHGVWRDGALQFTGVSKKQDGTEVLHELTFTPSGGVRQVWRTSKDRGSSWAVVFDGRYRPAV